MDLDEITIQLPFHEARKRFLEYRNSVRDRLTDEDKSIMEGYRLLARGTRVLDINTVLKEGGTDKNGLPQLAIVRANATHCHFHRAFYPDGLHVLASTRDAIHNTRCTQQRITFPSSTFPIGRNAPPDFPGSARAIVPLVPPHLRPKASLFHYHILWEADWEVPPVDPILLKRIGARGPLFAVVAQWDLTDLERAVLSGRLLSS